MLNPQVLQQLESFGLTDDHLCQLVAVCQRGSGQVRWHIAPDGFLAKIEIALYVSRRDTLGMRRLTDFLRQKD